MEKIKIEDGSKDREYFTIIPNYILNHSTPYERDLYSQMKRIAGDNGKCYISRSNLAKQCKISLSRLKKSLKYLLDHHWIEYCGKKEVGSNQGKQQVNVYKMVNLWEINSKWRKLKKKSKNITE